MNFEMAQEMAEMEDIQVETVIVRDDIAISTPEQRRGVAGTVLIHKYAGFLSEKGVPLTEIKEKVELMMSEIKTIGMALTPPMVPTTGQYGFIGIHGEKGLHREAIQPVDQIVSTLVEELDKEISGEEFIVMVNGMGGTPLSELNIVTKYLKDLFDKKHYGVKHWYVGDFMTSLDMQGFSITLVPANEEWLTAFLAPTTSRYFNS